MTFPDSETGDGFTESVWSDTSLRSEQLTNPLVILETPSSEVLYTDSVAGKDMLSDGGRGCEGNVICASYVYQLSPSLLPHLSSWTSSLFYVCQNSHYSSVKYFSGISNCRKRWTRNKLFCIVLILSRMYNLLKWICMPRSAPCTPQLLVVPGRVKEVQPYHYLNDAPYDWLLPRVWWHADKGDLKKKK